jgi:hypothetical protein
MSDAKVYVPQVASHLCKAVFPRSRYVPIAASLATTHGAFQPEVLPPKFVGVTLNPSTLVFRDTPGVAGGSAACGYGFEICPSAARATELGRILALSQSMWPHHFRELGPFPTPKLRELYRRPSMST